MIHSIAGKLAAKGENAVILETAGFGLKILAHRRTLGSLPEVGADIKLFCCLYVREDGLELYGFLTSEELGLFELLNSVAGVGPKSALSILEITDTKGLAASIKEGRPDLLTRASGIGRKTAERIILELKNKVRAERAEATVKKLESDADLAEALVGLGYRRDQAKAALGKVDEAITRIEERLKAALTILGRK